MPPDVPASAIRASIDRARADLLGGRGPGAGESEVAAHTRNRVEIAGMPAPRRLESAARQAAGARGDIEAIAEAIQLDRAHAAAAVTEPVRPRRLARDAVPAHRSHRALLVLGTAVALRALSRHRSAQP
jgi:hypothetical protein